MRDSLARVSGEMRPSKFRLPDNTDATTRWFSLIASLMGSGRGPRVADARRTAVSQRCRTPWPRDHRVDPTALGSR